MVFCFFGWLYRPDLMHYFLIAVWTIDDWGSTRGH